MHGDRLLRLNGRIFITAWWFELVCNTPCSALNVKVVEGGTKELSAKLKLELSRGGVSFVKLPTQKIKEDRTCQWETGLLWVNTTSQIVWC